MQNPDLLRRLNVGDTGEGPLEDGSDSVLDVGLWAMAR